MNDRHISDDVASLLTALSGRLGPDQLALLRAIAENVSDPFAEQPTAQISHRQLADATGLPLTAIAEDLRRLIYEGCITKNSDSGRTCVYAVQRPAERSLSRAQQLLRKYGAIVDEPSTPAASKLPAARPQVASGDFSVSVLVDRPSSIDAVADRSGSNDAVSRAWADFVAARTAYRSATLRRNQLRSELTIKRRSSVGSITVNELNAHVDRDVGYQRAQAECLACEETLWKAIAQLDLAWIAAGVRGQPLNADGFAW